EADKNLLAPADSRPAMHQMSCQFRKSLQYAISDENRSDRFDGKRKVSGKLLQDLIHDRLGPPASPAQGGTGARHSGTPNGTSRYRWAAPCAPRGDSAGNNSAHRDASR